MAGKVFFSVSMSLDGFIAPESLEDLMGQQWMELQQWVFPQRFFRENLKLGEGGEEGRDNDILRETFERTGASVMGKRMFDAGEQAWPEEAPFHTPVFVVTHEKRDPWQRPGGTTFHFVNEGIEPALDQAREAAGDRDVRIAGGGATILAYVNAGLVDEFTIALSPVLFGSGVRLFEGVDAGRVALELDPCGADAAGDPPDLRRPGAVAVPPQWGHVAACPPLRVRWVSAWVSTRHPWRRDGFCETGHTASRAWVAMDGSCRPAVREAMSAFEEWARDNPGVGSSARPAPV